MQPGPDTRPTSHRGMPALLAIYGNLAKWRHATCKLRMHKNTWGPYMYSIFAHATVRRVNRHHGGYRTIQWRSRANAQA